MKKKDSYLIQHFRFFPVYTMGFFCLSIQPMVSLLIPLWALSLGATPLLIGLSVSAGAILPMMFSINSGVIIDRFGSAKILRLSSIIIVVLLLAYPWLPFISVLIALQLLAGLIQSMNWISAQTYVAKLNRQASNNEYASYFSFAVNLGNFVGPLIVGFTWDYIAPWASFVTVSVWCLCLWLSALLLPAEKEGSGIKQPIGVSNLLPRWQNYKRAFSLLVLPAVAVVIYGTFMRLSAVNIKGSFYMVYLQQIDFSALAIATLFSFWSFAGTFSSLAVSFLSRVFRSETLLFAAVMVSLIPLCLTPLFADYSSHMIINIISGLGLGMTLPLLISILGNAVSPEEQGIAVGLRSTANYTASVIIPLIFGLWVQFVGLTLSFYIIGAMLMLPMFFIVPAILRNHKKPCESAGKL